MSHVKTCSDVNEKKTPENFKSRAFMTKARELGERESAVDSMEMQIHCWFLNVQIKPTTKYLWPDNN